MDEAPRDPGDAVDVAVVGAGVAGLAAARVARSTGLSAVVLERDPVHVGGRVKTIQAGGAPVDVGANFVASFYRTTTAIGELDLDDPSQFVERNSAVFTLREGRQVAVWPPSQLLRTDVGTLLQRLRGIGLIVPLLGAWPSLDSTDIFRASSLDRQSVHQLGMQWCGREVTDVLLDPMCRGVFGWDIRSATQVSILMMLKEAIHGLHFHQARGGMSTVVDRLASGVDVRSGHDVRTIRRSGSGHFVVDADVAGRSSKVHARAVVIATTAGAAARLCADHLADEHLELLAEVEYGRGATITCGLRGGVKPFPGSLMFPLAVSPLLTSVNCGASPEPEAPLVNIGVNRNAPTLRDVTSESDLIALVLGHLSALLPEAAWVNDLEVEAVSYWDESLPTFAVGHIRRMMSVVDSLAGGGVRLAGDYIGGPHLEGAVLSGVKAIESLAHGWLR